MALKQVIEIIDFLDSAKVTGRQVGELFTCRGWAGWEVETIESDKGSTDFITVALPGSEGRRAGAMPLRWESSVGWGLSAAGLS